MDRGVSHQKALWPYTSSTLKKKNLKHLLNLMKLWFLIKLVIPLMQKRNFKFCKDNTTSSSSYRKSPPSTSCLCDIGQMSQEMRWILTNADTGSNKKIEFSSKIRKVESFFCLFLHETGLPIFSVQVTGVRKNRQSSIRTQAEQSKKTKKSKSKILYSKVSNKRPKVEVAILESRLQLQSWSQYRFFQQLILFLVKEFWAAT